jgi:hypothetical protein
VYTQVPGIKLGARTFHESAVPNVIFLLGSFETGADDVKLEEIT